MAKPMNILFITSDQQRWDALGAVNDLVSTPNLDRLKERGMVFERAYTVNPVCTPSRVSMLTGHYPSRHGCFHVGTSLPDAYGPTVGEQLQTAGYDTALIGKAHFKPCYQCEGSLESEPMVHELDRFRSWNGPYYGFEHVELCIGHTSEGHSCGMHYGVWLEEQGIDTSKYFGIHDYQHFGTWDLPQEYHGSHWIADRSIAAIDRSQAAEKPFFLWSSFQDPHNPYVVPEPWASLYDPATLPIPSTEGDEESAATKPPFYKHCYAGEHYGDDPDICGNDAGDVKPLDYLSDDDVRKIYAAYYGMVSFMDFEIGRILDHLEETGLIDSTVIVFTSDHGDMLGSHGLWGKGLPAYEEVQRVPMVVAHPDCVSKGEHSQSLHSVVDLCASFCSIAGIETDVSNQGIDQSAAWTDSAQSVRDWVLYEFQPSEGPFTQRCFIEQKWKLVCYWNRPYGELYDLEADPQQQTNLFDLAEFQDIKNELLHRFISAEMNRSIARPRLAYA